MLKEKEYYTEYSFEIKNEKEGFEFIKNELKKDGYYF